MKHQSLPVCTECRRNTPRLGESVCGRCQEVAEEQCEREALINEFYAQIDEIQCQATQACLRALFRLSSGEVG